MEPEEIIQQKTWEQLTDQEKIVLAELAPTREDYNMLKKLMALAADAASSSGEVPPALRVKLENKLEAELNPKRKYRMAFYYAAASIVALFVLFIALRNQGKKETDLVTLPKLAPKQQPLPDTVIIHQPEKRTMAVKDVSADQKKPSLLSATDTVSFPKKPSNPVAIAEKQIKETSVKEAKKSISVEDLLKDDNLSSFITSVY
jgi:hypothetical protein